MTPVQHAHSADRRNCSTSGDTGTTAAATAQACQAGDASDPALGVSRVRYLRVAAGWSYSAMFDVKHGVHK